MMGAATGGAASSSGWRPPWKSAWGRSGGRVWAWNHQHRAANGVRLHYVRHGAGTPLVLLHGWPEFWRTWRKNIPPLAERFDVIAPDLRGFGESDKPARPALEGYTLDHHVEDLRALADGLRL